MKITELMIGDLVTYTGDDEGPIEGIIDAINPRLDYEIEILGTDAKINEIEPIPLTAEILEKNGFVNKTQFMQCGNFGKEFLITWQLKEEKVLGHCESFLKINNWSKEDRPSYSGKCLYVHELQHAFRLSGLYELADNFKI